MAETAAILRPQPVWTASDYDDYVPPQGYIKDYLAYAVRCTDAPPLYHIIDALGIASIAIAPYLDLVFEGQVHALHMFLLIIGCSSRSRKTSSIKRAAKVAAPVFAELNTGTDRLYWLAMSSPEGVQEELVKDANRLLLLSEWTDLHRLASSAGYWKQSTEMFNSIYDATDSHRAKAKSSAVITRPRVSILGASTKELVEAAALKLDWLSGKLARYLIGCGIRPDDREMEAEVDEPETVDQLRKQLGRLFSTVMYTRSKEIALSPEAWDHIRTWQRDDWWKQLEASAGSHLHPSFARAQEHVFRIAAIYEATATTAIDKIIVGVDCARAATALVNWCYKDMVEALACRDDERNTMLRVVNTLKAAGTDGLSRSTLLRLTRIPAKSVTEIIDTLTQSYEVEVTVRNTSGRSATYYCWAPS